jgi:hypothetical protein
VAVSVLWSQGLGRVLDDRTGDRLPVGHEWSIEIATAPDRRALLPGLAADLKRLVASGRSPRAVAQLSSYVAMIATSSGDTALARRWWRRAHRAAERADDGVVEMSLIQRHASFVARGMGWRIPML